MEAQESWGGEPVPSPVEAKRTMHLLKDAPGMNDAGSEKAGVKCSRETLDPRKREKRPSEIMQSCTM